MVLCHPYAINTFYHFELRIRIHYTFLYDIIPNYSKEMFVVKSALSFYIIRIHSIYLCI